MGSRGRRVSREKRRKRVYRMEDLPIRPRRAAAALISLLLALGGIHLSVHTEAEFDRAGEAVRTQEHQWSIIVDKDPGRRGRTWYYIEVNGQKELLDDPGFLPDRSLYAPVWYVVDPEDESNLIAVGSPGDWDDEPWNTSFGGAVLGVSLVLFLLISWGRIVPEDGRAAWDKFFPSSRPPGRRARDLTPRRSSQARHVR